jgi:hypothetical protein
MFDEVAESEGHAAEALSVFRNCRRETPHMTGELDLDADESTSGMALRAGILGAVAADTLTTKPTPPQRPLLAPGTSRT